MAGYPAAICRSFLAFGLAELGALDEALRWGREGLEIAGTVRSAMTSVWATSNLAYVHCLRGETQACLDLMRPNYELCRRSEVKLIYSQTAGLLGHALAEVGQLEEGIPLLEAAVRPENLDHHTEGVGYPIVWLAMALGATGRMDEGLGQVDRAREIASRQGERGHLAWALFAQAGLEARAGLAAAQVRARYGEALRIAESCAMRPLADRCRHALGSS